VARATGDHRPGAAVGLWPEITVGEDRGVATVPVGVTVGEFTWVVGDAGGVEGGELVEGGGVTVKGWLARTPEVTDPTAGS
jgi:hypothetical protein